MSPGAAGPGPRPAARDAERTAPDRPHVTENDHGAPLQESAPAPGAVPAMPANAHGRDVVDAHRAVPAVDDESMYERRPGEDKDRHETDMP